MSARLASLLAACAVAVASSGCGWHAGLVEPEGASTIAVQFFDVDEDVLQRDLSPELQGALTAAVSDLVDLRLGGAPSDLVIRGRITGYGRRSGIRSSDHDLLETAAKVVAEAELVRTRDGAVLATASGAVPIGYVTADRVVDPGTGDEDFLVGGLPQEREARERAFRILAEGLVLDLFAAAVDTRSPALP